MFDFVRNRRFFYLLSAVLLIPGIISLVLPGGLNPGIDFTSGTIMTIQFDSPVDQNKLRDAFAQIGHSEAIVQQSTGENTFVVRTRPLAQAQQTDTGDLGTSERQQIEQALTASFGPMQILNLDQVSPLIPGDRPLRHSGRGRSLGVHLVVPLVGLQQVTHPVRYGTTASWRCCMTR